MRITLYYNFDNEVYREGPDSFKVTEFDFPYELEILDKKVMDMTLNELYTEYREKALDRAAYKLMCEYADTAF